LLLIKTKKTGAGEVCAVTSLCLVQAQPVQAIQDTANGVHQQRYAKPVYEPLPFPDHARAYKETQAKICNDVAAQGS
jgi:hypothetical protein